MDGAARANARGAARAVLLDADDQVLFNYEYLRDNPERIDDPAWTSDFPTRIVTDIRRSLAHPDRLAYYQLDAESKADARSEVQAAAGGGSHSARSGQTLASRCSSTACSTWNELDTWVNKFGVDPMFAIRAATYWPSVAMKVDRDVGTVAAGKFADIIAVRGDVLRYIDLLQTVDVVVKHGVRYK